MNFVNFFIEIIVILIFVIVMIKLSDILINVFGEILFI